MILVLLLAVVLVTTVRHEGSHALAAWALGVPVHEVRLLPGVHPERGFYFGYVMHEGGGWLVDAAPFLAALLWGAAAVLLLARYPAGSRARFPLILIGLVSPLVDLAYNYQGGLWRQGTDVFELFAALPDGPVHFFFLAALAGCLAALRWARRPGPARASGGRATLR